MATHRRRAAHGADFYPTPRWATEALLEREHFKKTVAEFCCGNGAISRVLKQRGYTVYSSDLHDRGYGEQGDAFAETRRVSNIVTNPPFNLANALILHWKPLFRRKMCLLLRTAFLEGARRYDTIFSDFPPARMYVFSERVTMYPDGVTTGASGTTSYSWFVWDKKYSGETIVRWIEPGSKIAKARTASKTIR